MSVTHFAYFPRAFQKEKAGWKGKKRREEKKKRKRERRRGWKLSTKRGSQ